MRRLAALTLPLVLLLALLVASGRGGAEAHAMTLRRTVGLGFTITLATAQGNVVKERKAGAYTIRIRDLSPVHNFHLVRSGREQEDLGRRHRPLDPDGDA